MTDERHAQLMAYIIQGLLLAFATGAGVGFSLGYVAGAVAMASYGDDAKPAEAPDAEDGP